MRAALMYGAGDVRVEEVSMSPGDGPVHMGHEFIGVVEEVGTEGVPGAYQDMADRKALKVLVR